MDEALRSTDLGAMGNCFGLEPEVTQEDEVSFFGSTIKNGHREQSEPALTLTLTHSVLALTPRSETGHK